MERGKLKMDKKVEVMVSLAAAIGANCIPCFDYIYSKAKELNLEEAEIQRVVEAAFMVKNGAQVFMKNAVNEMTGEPAREAPPCRQPAGGCCN
jgi:alkylhydroperoxidase/carboxymuconolactone decarboxylase family protein YurZ